MTTLTTATPAFGSSFLPGPVSRPAAPAGGILTGADIIRTLRQRLVMILLLWFFLTGITVAFTLYMQVKHPEYEAESLVRVESLQPPDPEDPLRRDSTIDQAKIERELQNQALLVKSSDVLSLALQDPELKRTTWYTEADKLAKEKNERHEDLLLDILSVGPLADSNYLRVTATWRVKTEVPTIINVVVDQYVRLIEKRQKQFVNSAKEQLTAELERAQRQLKSKKQEIEDFQNTTEFSDEALQEVHERVLTLETLVTELDVELLGRKAQYESLQNARPEDLPITAELQAILNSDPTLYQFEQRLMQTQDILDQAQQRYGPNHRIVRDSMAARDMAAQTFQKDRAAKIVHFQSRQIEQARRNFLEAQEQLLSLREKLFQAKAEQRDKQIKKAQYDALLDERELLRLQYEKLLEQKNVLEMLTRQKQTVQIEVASRATAPERMSSPQLAIWIPGGTMFGLFISVGLALLLELADKSVRTPRDVARAHLPVLGTIPTTDDDEVEIDRVETACLDAPHSIVAEAFRSLRANLFFSAPAEQQGVILITSPSGGNGKTTIAANMAISIALSGRRVLLIDANFRRAALPRIFNNMKPEGLSNILIGQGDLKDFTTHTGVPGLDVLSAGPLPPNPAELLGSSYLRDVVVDARSRYDQVIFDGPPVLLVSDAMVLAGAVDGVMLICEYRNTSRGALQRTQANLEAINVRIFGAVLNKVQSRAGGYFRKAYREFYEYHEPDENVTAPRAKLDQQSAAETAASGAFPSSDSRSGPHGGMPEDRTSPAQLGRDEYSAAPAPEEPPMAATIEEAESGTTDLTGSFRDVGEPPPVADGRDVDIADMSDVEDVDAFQMPEASAWEAPAAPEPPHVEDSWTERAAPPSTDSSVAFEDGAPPLSAPDAGSTPAADSSESPDFDVVMPEPQVDAETSGEVGAGGEASPFDLLEDEADLGDDLTDLDSDEFRIDDKFDLDDDFDDPNSQPPRTQ